MSTVADDLLSNLKKKGNKKQKANKNDMKEVEEMIKDKKSRSKKQKECHFTLTLLLEL